VAVVVAIPVIQGQPVVLAGVGVDVNKPPGVLVMTAGILLLRVMLAVLAVLLASPVSKIMVVAVAEVIPTLPVKLQVALAAVVQLAEL
jgi:hypothetical protein